MLAEIPSLFDFRHRTQVAVKLLPRPEPPHQRPELQQHRPREPERIAA